MSDMQYTGTRRCGHITGCRNGHSHPGALQGWPAFARLLRFVALEGLVSWAPLHPFLLPRCPAIYLLCALLFPRQRVLRWPAWALRRPIFVQPCLRPPSSARRSHV